MHKQTEKSANDSTLTSVSQSFDEWIDAQEKWVRLCACKNTVIREAMVLAYSANNHVENCDHNWIWIDDSFDTGIGFDHKCGHSECSKCGESKG